MAIPVERNEVVRTGFNLRSIEVAVFWVLVLLYLIPLFLSKYFATQDGPCHLYNVFLIKNLLAGSPGDYSHFFHFNPKISPNWITHGLLLIFSFALPFYLAEKLLLGLYVILMPLAFRYLFRAINPASTFFSLLSFPLVYSVTLYFGFYNFCFSIILFLYASGFWIRHSGLFNFRQSVIFFLLTTVLIFAHPLSYLLLIIFLFFLFVPFLVADFREHLPLAMRRIIKTLIPLSPSLAFAAYYGLSGKGGYVPSNGDAGHIWSCLVNSNFISYLGEYDWRIARFFGFFLIGTSIISLFPVFIKGQNRKYGSIFFFLLCLIPLCIFSPEEFAGGSIITLRLGLYFAIFLLCWSVVAIYPLWFRNTAVIVFVLFSSTCLVFQTLAFSGIARQTTEYLKIGKYLAPGKLMIQYTGPVVKELPGGTTVDTYIDPCLHICGYLAIEREMLSLDNYEAATDYFPLRWQKRLDAEYLISGRNIMPDLSYYEQLCQRKIDYVILWNTSPEDAAVGINWQLRDHYKEVPMSLKIRARLFERI